jgi:hypothetical protein
MYNLQAFTFCSFSVSGIRMVSDHIADGERGWMSIVEDEIHHQVNKFKKFLSPLSKKRLLFRHFSEAFEM